MQVAWIGLGSMGNAMALNMQRHLAKISLPPLRYFNRTPKREQPLRQLGALRCDSIPDLVSESDVIFISLSDDAAVELVTQQIIASGDVNGKIIVDTTTVHPDTTRKISAVLAKAHAILVAAPVFGATPVAEAGTLLVAVSGPEQAVRMVHPLIRDAFAREVFIVSDEADKAVLLKTIGNFMTAGFMEIVAEAHVLAEKSGLSSSLLANLIQQNYGTLAHSHSERMTQGIYCPAKDQAPYSGLDLALKDIGHGLSSAREQGVTLGVGEVVIDHLRKAKTYSDEHQGRALDSSSLYGVVRIEAGLDFETDLVKERDRSISK